MKLVLKFDSGRTVSHEVFERTYTIGRAEECRVCVKSEHFSREHALIELIDTTLYITDMGSKNGIFMNHIRIPSKTRVSYDPKYPLYMGECFITIDTTKDLRDEDYLSLETHPRMNSGELYSPMSDPAPIIRLAPKPREEESPVKNQSSWSLVLAVVLIAAIVIYVSRAKAEDYILKDEIAENYTAGSFLIYDCKEGHWVCVLESGFKKCTEERDLAVKKLKKFLPCAPIGEMPSKKGCFQRTLYLTSHAHGSRFCILDSLKKEVLD